MDVCGTTWPVTKKENIKLRLDTETLQQLQERAREAERTVAAEIRLAIKAHLSVERVAA